jgi:predicted ATPase
MKIEIRNFGPIDFLEFDLSKDLHLIYGENAIGKSYATYLLYCLIKNVKNKAIQRSYWNFTLEDESRFGDFYRKQLNRLKKSSKKEVDITTQFKELLRKEFDDLFVQNFQNSLLNSFSSLKNLKNRYSNSNYSILLRFDNGFDLGFISDDEGMLNVEVLNDFLPISIVEKNTKSTKFSLLVDGKKRFGKANEEAFGREFYYFFVQQINYLLELLDNNTRDVYYLPASRSGLYQALNAFTPIIAELTQNRFFIQNKSIELPSLPEPLSDYFIDLSTVNNKNVNKEFSDIVSVIQKNILKGEVSYDDKKKQILFNPSNLKLSLNLAESSSMVAEISPIVVYLKHILNYKYSSNRGRDTNFFDPYYSRSKRKEKGYDILFIEEPEAHLHPEVQVLLMEIFTKLVKSKVKIFITSHSNYMFNKINNIILKDAIDVKKLTVYHLVHKDLGTKQNLDMIASDEGIMDENFQSTSEKLYNERMEILD